MTHDIGRLQAAILAGGSVLIDGRCITTLPELNAVLRLPAAPVPAAPVQMSATQLEAAATELAEAIYKERIERLLEAAPPLQLNGLLAMTVAQLREECAAVGVEPGDKTKADLIEALARLALAASRTAWVVEVGDAAWSGGVETDPDLRAAIYLHDQRSADQIGEWLVEQGLEAVASRQIVVPYS